MDNKQLAVLKTLAYSDIFSHPLTLSEVWYYCESQKMTKTECRTSLESLFPLVAEKKGYYFLKKRSSLIPKREKGERHAQKKIILATAVAKVLGRIPTIYFIGISGRVASGSATKSDDIDFFIITKKNTLFITRFVILLVLQLLGKRRGRKERRYQDKICVNMMLDEKALVFPHERRTLYTAREIAQLLPLFQRNNTYQRFFRSNIWARSFLPHISVKRCVVVKSSLSLLEQGGAYFLSLPFVEYWARTTQMRSINLHRTNETVADRFLAFHPYDYQAETLRIYQRLTRRYERIIRSNKRVQAFAPNLDKERNIFYTA